MIIINRILNMDLIIKHSSLYTTFIGVLSLLEQQLFYNIQYYNICINHNIQLL